jgi:hypothetical protein
MKNNSNYFQALFANESSRGNLNSVYNPNQSAYTPTAYSLANGAAPRTSSSNNAFAQGSRDPRYAQQSSQPSYGLAMMSQNSYANPQPPAYAIQQQQQPPPMSANPFFQNRPYQQQPVSNNSINSYGNDFGGIGNGGNINNDMPDRGMTVLFLLVTWFCFCFSQVFDNCGSSVLEHEKSTLITQKVEPDPTHQKKICRFDHQYCYREKHSKMVF